MFLFCTTAILVVALASIGWAAYRLGDTLHPLVYLMPMATYLYVWLPYSFYSGEGVLLEYFSLAELTYAQSFNLACVIALAIGVLGGGGGLQRDARHTDVHTAVTSPAWCRRLFRMGLFFGAVGVLLYVYSILNSGGFYEAYNNPKGGGSAGSGYLRDFRLMVIPGIVLIYLSWQKYRWTWGATMLVTLFASPFLLRGLLSARRGPTFIAATALGAGWYLARDQRPRLWQVLTGGAALGLLMLALVTFRGQIYLGSSFFSGEGPSTSEIVSHTLERDADPSYENEFIYSTYLIHDAREHNFHHWGKRYLTILFIRPIPRQIWPTKYEDVGMEVILSNAGLLRGGPEMHPYVPQGAAAGIAGALFVEFAWGGVLAALFLGWGYGLAWRRCLTRGGVWTIIYTCLVVVSVFMMLQSIGASLFRFLVMLVPSVLAWRYAEGQVPAIRQRRRLLDRARRRLSLVARR